LAAFFLRAFFFRDRLAIVTSRHKQHPTVGVVAGGGGTVPAPGNPFTPRASGVSVPGTVGLSCRFHTSCMSRVCRARPGPPGRPAPTSGPGGRRTS